MQEDWSVFIDNPKIEINKCLAGSLPWDSGYYYFFNSSPNIEYFHGKMFEDWFLLKFDGIFLKRWLNNPGLESDLIFLDLVTYKIHELKKWRTRSWSVITSPDEIQFYFKRPEEITTFIVDYNSARS